MTTDRIYINPQDVRNITCIGGGPIGAGWSAFFLARGYEVTSYLHDPAEEPGLRALIDNAWISLQELGLADGASLDNLRCTSNLADACANADFVQESAPENITLKRALYAQLGELVPAHVVIASSTSGLSMSGSGRSGPSFQPTLPVAAGGDRQGRPDRTRRGAMAGGVLRTGGKSPPGVA
jgi:carnitine 3-dehydrogenase